MSFSCGGGVQARRRRRGLHVPPGAAPEHRRHASGARHPAGFLRRLFSRALRRAGPIWAALRLLSRTLSHDALQKPRTTYSKAPPANVEDGRSRRGTPRAPRRQQCDARATTLTDWREAPPGVDLTMQIQPLRARRARPEQRGPATPATGGAPRRVRDATAGVRRNLLNRTRGKHRPASPWTKSSMARLSATEACKCTGTYPAATRRPRRAHAKAAKNISTHTTKSSGRPALRFDPIAFVLLPSTSNRTANWMATPWNHVIKTTPFTARKLLPGSISS